MQIRLFTIPVFGDEAGEQELNKFLRSHRVLDVHQELVSNNAGSYWCFSVRYLDDESKSGGGERGGKASRKERVDYKEILSEEAFKVFAALRKRRKEIAKDEGIPAFAILTDSEMAEVAKAGESGRLTPASLKEVQGVGENKIERYGEKLLEGISQGGEQEESRSEASGESVPENS